MSTVLAERTFSEVKRLCCAGLEGPALLGGVIERLRRAVPFEAYCASTLDPASGLITHSLAEDMGGIEEATIFFERLYFEHDETIRRMANVRHSVILLSETTDGDLGRSARYVELLHPLGLAYEMRGAFASGGYLWGSMDLIREAGSPDFDAREVSLLRRIAPHLGNGLKMAALRVQAHIENGGTDIPGVLTLDYRGRVTQHTPAAERWLRDLEDLDLGWREWNRLPTVVRMVATALRRALSTECGSDMEREPRLRVRSRSGRWLTLYGSLTEPANGNTSETVIVIEPSKPEEVAWLNVVAYGLTPREEEIAGLIVRGFSTKQVSKHLYISEYTVQNHLSNIFEKVGVRSRRDLVKKLFFEDLYPSLFG